MTSNFRITPQMTARLTMSNLQNNVDSLNRLQDELSSMKKLRKPSDDPVGTVSALQYRSQLARNDQVSRNISDGLSWLNLADSTLSSIVTQLQRVRALSIQGANATADASARDAMASEIDGIRQTIIGLANTKNLDRPIFGGNASGGIAYDTTGNYVGQSGAVTRTVAPGVQMQVNVNGDEVFGAAGNDLFTALGQIANDLRTNPGQLGADVTSLDTRMSAIQDSQATIGARQARLDTMKNRNDTDGITLKQSLSDVEDADLAQTTLKLQIQQVAYQAALQATAKVIQPSLVDFLK